MNTRKIVSIILFIALLAGLAACGNSNNTNTGGSNSESPGASSSSGGELQKAELNVFIQIPRFRTQFETLVNAFVEQQKQEKNREVKVNLEMPEEFTGNDVLRTRFATDSAPDVFKLHATEDAPQYAAAGYLEDLSDQPFVANLKEEIRNAVTQNGKIVALPIETPIWGYLYNKKIFAENGLTPPKTLTEMKEVIAKLEEKKITPFVLSYKTPYMTRVPVQSVQATYQFSHPEFVEKMNKGEGSYADIQTDMFNVLDLVNAHGTDNALELDADGGAAAFAAGKGAMWIQGVWYAEALQKLDPSFEFSVAPLPIDDNADRTSVLLSTSTSLAVSSKSPNKEIALDFINFIVNNEKASNELYSSLKVNPISNLHTFGVEPWVEESMAYNKVPEAYTPVGVLDKAGQMLQMYYAGQATQEEVVKELDKAWDLFNQTQ